MNERGFTKALLVVGILIVAAAVAYGLRFARALDLEALEHDVKRSSRPSDD